MRDVECFGPMFTARENGNSLERAALINEPYRMVNVLRILRLGASSLIVRLP